MKLFHVDASPKGERSTSRMLAGEFVDLLRAREPDIEIDYLDLSATPPSYVTGPFAQAIYTPAEQRTDAMKALLAESDALCARLLAADHLLFSMPMYNWSMPASFKAFIDMIVRGGVTYIAQPDGSYAGQLAGKKILFLTSRGADLRESMWDGMDGLTPSLRAAFAFIGGSDQTFVDVQPMQFASPEARAEGLERGRADLRAVADIWAPDMAFA